MALVLKDIIEQLIKKKPDKNLPSLPQKVPFISNTISVITFKGPDIKAQSSLI